jgi:hypothetical protein
MQSHQTILKPTLEQILTADGQARLAAEDMILKANS